MKRIILNEIQYELVENYKDGYDEKLVEEKITDYFEPYDYIIGDFAYGKLRLKGFCNKENPIYRSINAIENKESYIKNDCAYECKYFVLKKAK